MHMHMLAGAILHATLLAIVGYFILLTATKASGLVSLIGKILALWVFLLAVGAIVCAVMGGPMMDKDGKGPGGWMHHWGPPPVAAPAPANNAAPAPSK
jgi:hypothetical protein